MPNKQGDGLRHDKILRGYPPRMKKFCLPRLEYYERVARQRRIAVGEMVNA